MPNVTKNLRWERLFVLLRFQKLPAIVIFGWGVSLDHHIGKFLAMGAITSGVLGQIYNDFNTILAFTSMVTTI